MDHRSSLARYRHYPLSLVVPRRPAGWIGINPSGTPSLPLISLATGLRLAQCRFLAAGREDGDA